MTARVSITNRSVTIPSVMIGSVKIRLVKIIVLAIVVVLACISMPAMQDAVIPELKEISIDPDLGRLQRQDILGRLASMDPNSMPLDDVKETLEKAEWVRFVSAKRVWPARLVIEVTPQTPIAYWNDDSYINSAGQIFRSEFIKPMRLPHLYGQEDKGAEMMTQYQKLNMALNGSGFKIQILHLNDRGVWSFQDQAGIEVILGKHSISERLRRFLKVYAKAHLEEKHNLIERIDTRYSNGVAISWKETKEDYEIAGTH